MSEQSPAGHPDVNADGTLWTDPVPNSDLPAGVQRVAVALARLGAAGQIRELPERAATAATAAAALDVEIAAICNSLVFDADRSPLLVLASGAHRVDLTKVAGIVGASTVRRATPELVRAATGQPIGGVAPVGHPNPLRTLVDVDLSRQPVVWAAGGHPHFVFPTSYGELLRITAGEAVELAEC